MAQNLKAPSIQITKLCASQLGAGNYFMLYENGVVTYWVNKGSVMQCLPTR